MYTYTYIYMYPVIHFAYIYVCIYVRIYLRIPIRIHIHICLYMYIDIHICMNIRVCLCVCVRVVVCVFVCVNICIHVYTCSHTTKTHRQKAQTKITCLGATVFTSHPITTPNAPVFECEYTVPTGCVMLGGRVILTARLAANHVCLFVFENPSSQASS